MAAPGCVVERRDRSWRLDVDGGDGQEDDNTEQQRPLVPPETPGGLDGGGRPTARTAAAAPCTSRNLYLHKKFKKLDVPSDESDVFAAPTTNNDKPANLSLEALFEVTGHELEKIKCLEFSCASRTTTTTMMEDDDEVDEETEDSPEEHQEGQKEVDGFRNGRQVRVAGQQHTCCPFCGLNCGKPSVLLKHVRAHTNERPFPCEPCGFAFKTKSNLYKHCKSRSHCLKVGLPCENGADSDSDDDEEGSTASPPLTKSPSSRDECGGGECAIRGSETTGPSIYKPKFHLCSDRLPSDDRPSLARRRNEHFDLHLDISAARSSSSGDSGVTTTTTIMRKSSPKLTSPEYLQQHISKLISQNAAIVDMPDPLWPRRYARQSSVAMDVEPKSRERLRRHSDGVSPSLARSKLACALLAPASPAPVTDDETMHGCHPQNPEGSIIKDLLLKARFGGVGVVGTRHMSGGSLSEVLPSSRTAEEPVVVTPDAAIDEGFEGSRLKLALSHKPRGRPRGSKNRPKTDLMTPSVSPAPEPLLLPPPLDEPTPSEGPILKKHLLAGTFGGEKSPPIKKRRVPDAVLGGGLSCLKSLEHLSRYPMHHRPAAAAATVQLFGGEVQICDGGAETKTVKLGGVVQEPRRGAADGAVDDFTPSTVVTTIAKPVHNSGGTVLKVQENASSPAVAGPPADEIAIDISYLDLSSSSVVASTVDSTTSTVERPDDKESLAPLARPTSLPLKGIHALMIGSTLVSPETPRPRKKYGQCYLNGQYYTYLELKQSTKVYYCCIHRPQPMYVPQATDPKLSMYSVWQTVPVEAAECGVTPLQSLSLYDSTQRRRGRYTTASAQEMSALQTTHSSYWTFQQQRQRQRRRRRRHHEDQEDEDDEMMAAAEVQEDSEEDVEPRENEEERVSVSVASVPSAPAVRPRLLHRREPKRVWIFEGGFKSNEDYTYVRGRGRGKYVCEECGIRCKKPSMLKKHIRTHTDVRPYTCKHCNFSFKTKGNLTKHMKSKAHHKKCVEIGIVPVPIAIDDVQIDEEALARQERIEHQRRQFADVDDDSNLDDDDEDDDEEGEEEEDYEDEEASAGYREGEEAEDEDEEESIEGQFEDVKATDVDVATRESVIEANFEPTLPPSTDQEAIARSLLDLGRSRLLQASSEAVEGRALWTPTASRFVLHDKLGPDDAYVDDASSSYACPSGLGESSQGHHQLHGSGDADEPIDLSMPHTRFREYYDDGAKEYDATLHAHREVPGVSYHEENFDAEYPAASRKSSGAAEPFRRYEESSAEGTAAHLPATLVGDSSAEGIVQLPFMVATVSASGSLHSPKTGAVPATDDVLVPTVTFQQMAAQRPIDEGKCVCSICNKTFSRPSQLRLHVNIHYFERPFRCDSCAISFRTKGHLQKHKRSVSHYNKVNMNLTFGTPTTDNPRPFKCGDCKIAFRIHGHLAKHLRSKMHIMKLECLGKLPFGTYAEIERSGANLNEIDTTDCDNSLESLQAIALRLADKAAVKHWARVRTVSGGSCDDQSDGVPYVESPGDDVLNHEGGLARRSGASPDTVDKASSRQRPLKCEPPVAAAATAAAVAVETTTSKVLAPEVVGALVEEYEDISDDEGPRGSEEPPPRTVLRDAASFSPSGAGVSDNPTWGTAAKRLHFVGHDGEPFADLCSTSLKQHLMPQARPFMCDRCDVGFASAQLLSAHVQAHQRQETEDFCCLRCGQVFGSDVDLDRHLEGVHGDVRVR